MGVFEVSQNAATLIAEPAFDLEATRASLREITCAALFAAFAVRNAIANESLIPPAWRQDLYALAAEIAGRALPHLERDWAAEQARYDQITARLRAMDELEDTLRRDPRSAGNLMRPDENS